MNLTSLVALISLALCCVSTTYADTFGSVSNTFDIEFVDIGNPGNPADTTGNPNPAGKVDYAYRIGKYEISEDMINKANALGGLGITHDNRGADKAATSISWFEAATFVNWLNTSTGHTRAYKFNGSTFELWQTGDAGYDPGNRFRNSKAYYFLPSVHEWYKAAYYDPTAGVYYDYPTGSDSIPDGIDFAGDTTFDAVFSDGGPGQQPRDITNVGVLSPYGTAGQGGNVIEWEETEFDLINDNNDQIAARGLRGGYWGGLFSGLNTSQRLNIFPRSASSNFGFRVASVPEPTSLLLAVCGIVVSLSRRKRLPPRTTA